MSAAGIRDHRFAWSLQATFVGWIVPGRENCYEIRTDLVVRVAGTRRPLRAGVPGLYFYCPWTQLPMMPIPIPVADQPRIRKYPLRRRAESRSGARMPHVLIWILLVVGSACRQTVEPIGLAPAPQISGVALVEATTGNTIELLADGQTIDLALLPTRDLAMTVAFSGEGDAVLISYDGSQRLERCSPYSVLADNRGQFDCWDPPLGGTGVHTVTARPGRRCGSGAIWGDTQSLTFTVTDSDSGAAFSCGTRTEPLGPQCDTSSAYPSPDGPTCGVSTTTSDGG